MISKRLRGLPLIALGLLFLAGCQGDVPSDPAEHVLGGAAPSSCQNMCSIIKGGAGTQCKSLCDGVVDGSVDPEPGSKGLLAIAFAEWQAGNLQLRGGTTATEAIEDFSAAVLALASVASLPADEKHVWTEDVNLASEDVVAVGPTTSDDVFCFPNGQWCFQVFSDAGASYHFAAEAVSDQENLGECAGEFEHDCATTGIHMDITPDTAITPDTTDASFVQVWDCSAAGFDRHVRFEVLNEDSTGAGEFGQQGDANPPQLNGCSLATAPLDGWQRWAWTGLKPLAWVFGPDPLNAGTTGTTFGRASIVQAGELAIRVRDVTCVATARFASISDGAECRLFLNADLDPIDGTPTTDTVCTTVGDGKKVKSGRCTWEDLPVPADNTQYFAVVDKQDQTGTAHHAEGFITLAPGNPAKDEKLVCTFNLTQGTIVSCDSVPLE
jgi:hypothetical protein